MGLPGTSSMESPGARQNEAGLPPVFITSLKSDSEPLQEEDQAFFFLYFPNQTLNSSGYTVDSQDTLMTLRCSLRKRLQTTETYFIYTQGRNFIQQKDQLPVGTEFCITKGGWTAYGISVGRILFDRGHRSYSFKSSDSPMYRPFYEVYDLI